MTEQTTLTLKNDVEELERVMTFVSELCGRHSIPPDTEYDLNLSMDEIITNVAKHAFPSGELHEFSVYITVDDREFVIRIEDDGAAFNPLDHPAPDLDAPLETRREGGLGIYLVRQIMTSVNYERVTDKNVLTMKKTLAQST